MKDIYIRSITGTALVLAIVGSILLGKYVFAIFFFIITILGTHEFYKMLQTSKYHPQTTFGTIISGILYIILALVATGIISPLYLAIVVVLFFVIPIRELYRNNGSPIPNVAQTIFGVLYVSLTLGLMNFLFYQGHNGPETNHIILAFFIVLWTSDSFAYITGVQFGKHRLFERISPKKSWEGFIGGLVASILSGYIFSIFFNNFNIFEWIGFSIVICIAGVYGDLIQSMFKRSLGIKDSGNILPGHGGILDRFDAVFVAIPVAIAYITLIS